MNFLKLKYGIIFLAFFMSCENELDIEPAQSITTEQALESENNVLNLLIGTYAEAADGATFGGVSQVTADLLGTTNEVSWNGTFAAPREIILKNINIDNWFSTRTWANSFEVINNANLILDNLDVITSSENLE